MSNWDAYQAITTAAKQAGGVENLIRRIEDAAVDGASTRQRAQGAALVVAVVAAGAGAKYFRDRRAARREAAEVAKSELRRIVSDPDGPAVSPG